MSRFEGKVAFVTGAARGQGRSHAVRFAKEGARLILADACADMDAVAYPMATAEDLARTAELVEAEGAEVVSGVADVRNQAQLDALVAEGVQAFGRLDVVSANAGVFTGAENAWSLTEEQWNNTLDINLSGTWRTCKAAIPAMIEAGNGGAIVITASSNGYRSEHGHAAYSASKIGLVALMRTLAGEVAQHDIRVNTIHPMTVKTNMMWNDEMVALFTGGASRADVDEDEFWDGMAFMNQLPVGALEIDEVSELVLFLTSDAGRHITASEIPLDAGYIRKN
jgi:(+)-trans-carveol dehydrogenase